MVEGTVGRYKFQTELLLDGGEHARREIDSGSVRTRAVPREAQLEVVATRGTANTSSEIGIRNLADEAVDKVPHESASVGGKRLHQLTNGTTSLAPQRFHNLK